MTNSTTNTNDVSSSCGYATANYRKDEYLVFDIETAGRDDAMNLLDPVEPAKNLKDPEKIAADIKAKLQDRIDKLALDMNLNRIVAIAATGKTRTGEISMNTVCRDLEEEKAALWQFWSMAAPVSMQPIKLIGFCCLRFDLPVLIQRTRLHGLPEPRVDMGKYRNVQVSDLYNMLTFDLYSDTAVMRRSLKNFSALFGVPQFDDCDGAEIGELLKNDDWDGISKHCWSDVLRTWHLAQKLGVI